MCCLFMRNLAINHEKGNPSCDKFHVLFISVSSSVFWACKMSVQKFLVGV